MLPFFTSLLGGMAGNAAGEGLGSVAGNMLGKSLMSGAMSNMSGGGGGMPESMNIGGAALGLGAQKLLKDVMKRKALAGWLAEQTEQGDM